MKFRFLFFSVCIAFAVIGKSQKRFLYFDKFNQKSDKELAHSCLEYTVNGDKNYQTNWYYLSNGNAYFNGQITNIDTLNYQLKYKGECIWYYKDNKQKRIEPYDDNGILNGKQITYYENGNKQSEYVFRNGIKNNDTAKDYDEFGNEFLILKEDFADNKNEWDLYDSDKSFSCISDGKLLIQSKLVSGTARYISYPVNSDNWSYEAEFTYDKKQSPVVHGLVFNFKDWNNHGFFIVFGDNFSTGFIEDGVRTLLGDKISYGNFNPNKNTLKMIAKDGKLFFLINNEEHHVLDKPKSLSNKFGPLVIGKARVYCDNISFKLLSK